MNINATIIGQMLTFAIFIWINKKFVWPKMLNVILEREHKISQGLQAAELGEKKLQEAEINLKQQEIETRKRCNLLIAEAKKQAEQILELSILQAKNKENEIISNAQIQLKQEQSKLEQNLQENLVDLIIKSLEKIMVTNLNQELHHKILSDINNSIHGN